MNEKHYSFKRVLALMLVASALTCALLYFLIGRPLGVGTDRFDDVRTYATLRKYIDERYIGDVDNDLVNYASFSSAVYALDDRWSYYFSPEEYAQYLDSSQNQYSGIGIQISAHDETGGILVSGVYDESPAALAGVVAGDVIIAVDGTDITGLDYTEAADSIRTDTGNPVLLTLLGEDGIERDVSIVPGIIKTVPVTYSLLDGGIGYVKIDNFNGGCADAFMDAVLELADQGAERYVYDVRGNGGGSVYELTIMLDFLLPECEIFVSVAANGEELIRVSDEEMYDAPAVVLVNAHSYSAAEYFAAVLHEYDYAQVVGEQTTGKNRSQQTFELPDGGALHISTAEYLTPERVSLAEQGGFTPDIEVESADGFYLRSEPDVENDTQLKTAIEALQQS